VSGEITNNMFRKDKQRDYFTDKAKQEGYPARSVYKLKEIDKKYNLIKPDDRVLDLGCAPGSWLIYLAQKIGDKGEVIGLDIGELKIDLKPNMKFIKQDIMLLADKDLENLGKFNAAVSDAAPFTSGIRDLDTDRSFQISQKAFDIAEKTLLAKGNFLCKIFESQDSHILMKQIEQKFDFVKIFRPRAVTKNSREIYIVAKGYKGRFF